MTVQEFQTIYPHVINWIRDTLASHAAQAQIVASAGFRRLPLYFSPALLASTKFVAVERVPMPPLSALGLSQFAAFEQGDNDGITYLDTFFVKNNFFCEEIFNRGFVEKIALCFPDDVSAVDEEDKIPIPQRI